MENSFEAFLSEIKGILYPVSSRQLYEQIPSFVYYLFGMSMAKHTKKHYISFLLWCMSKSVFSKYLMKLCLNKDVKEVGEISQRDQTLASNLEDLSSIPKILSRRTVQNWLLQGVLWTLHAGYDTCIEVSAHRHVGKGTHTWPNIVKNNTKINKYIKQWQY